MVRGTGEARALPDLASLRVEVTADRKSQDEAYEARADVAAKVDFVFSQHANAIGRTTVASLWVQPRTRWHRGEDIRTGWRASRTTFVDVVVLDALGVIMSEVVAAGAAVTGPNWSMASTNIAYDLARRARGRRRPPPGHRLLRGAGADPGRRGLGAPSPACVPDPTPSAPSPMMVRAEHGGPRRSNELVEDLTPSEQTVEVSVEVGFTISVADRRVRH